jgi:hypothetical protein
LIERVRLPLYKLRCPRCEREKKVMRDKPPQECCPCGGEFQRSGAGPSSQVTERLDNGLMPRSLERLVDAERLHQERADGADPSAGRVQGLRGRDE